MSIIYMSKRSHHVNVSIVGKCIRIFTWTYIPHNIPLTCNLGRARAGVVSFHLGYTTSPSINTLSYAGKSRVQPLKIQFM